jgi:hypothetical protein
VKKNNPTNSPDHGRVQLFVYLIPVIGFLPALWILYRRQGTPQQQAVSRLAITLALSWLLGQVLLGMSFQASESLTLPVLLISSLLTTSYFIVNLGLMIRIWQRQSLWLPGLSQIAERVFRKHLS